MNASKLFASKWSDWYGSVNEEEEEVDFSIEKQFFWQDPYPDESDICDWPRMKFLIVEDDLLSQKILKEFTKIRDSGVECYLARSAPEAIGILEKKDIDVVVADYYLEGFYTGLDLWQLATKQYPNTEFVITSQMKESDYLDIVSGLKYPPPFLSKPLRFEDWKEVLSHTGVGGSLI